MGGSFVEYGGDRPQSPVQKSYEYLQLHQRENYNDDLPGRYFAAQRVDLDSIGLLLVIGW